MRRLGLLLFALFIVYFIFLIRQDIIDNLDLRSDRAQALKAIGQEQKLADRLTDRLSRLKDDELVEEIARTDLGLVKKGETAFKVIR